MNRTHTHTHPHTAGIGVENGINSSEPELFSAELRAGTANTYEPSSLFRMQSKWETGERAPTCTSSVSLPNKNVNKKQIKMKNMSNCCDVSVTLFASISECVRFANKKSILLLHRLIDENFH